MNNPEPDDDMDKDASMAADVAVERGKMILKMVIDEISELPGTDVDRDAALMSAVAHIFAIAYMAQRVTYGPEAGDDWLTKVFQIVQALIAGRGYSDVRILHDRRGK